ncbi:MAG: hypothetical protein JNG90_18490 [Planctomycetaceae bacterium]|nr:hypothetical protein [Planctomycetaceae bacterium]
MIDFRCTQCGRLLRTPDDAAGKQAQCPSCGAIQPVPAASAPESASPTLATPPSLNPPPSFPSANPYAGTAYETIPQGGVPAGPIVPSRLDPGEALSKSWRIAQPQILWLFLFGLVYMIVSYLAGGALGLAAQLIKVGAGLRGPEFDVLAQLLVQFASQFVSIFLSLGAAIYTLKLARGQNATLVDLFAGFPYFIRGVVAMFLISLILLGLAIPCAIPAGVAAVAVGPESPATVIAAVAGFAVWGLAGTIVWLMVGQVYYVLVDRNVGAIEALGISRRITAGNRLVLFVLYILLGVFVLIGMCALCLPFFFALGFGFLLLTVAYLIISGQPTIADAPPASANPFAPGAAPQPEFGG